jgi:hypothetical protein
VVGDDHEVFVLGGAGRGHSATAAGHDSGLEKGGRVSVRQVSEVNRP